jgi:uncharacterized protein involved in exopolysaccharide biosynthesis
MAPDEYDDLDEGNLVPHFLQDPLGIPMRRKWVVLTTVVIGIAISLGFALTRTPTYLASATILVTSKQFPREFVRTTVTDDPFSRLSGMIGVVLSRQKLVELIDELDLYPEERTKVALDGVVGMMRGSISIELQRQRARGPVNRNATVTARMFDVRYRSADREKAAVVANRIAALFVEGGLQSRMEQAIGIGNFMRSELERTEVSLRTLRGEILDFKDANRGHLPNELESNLRRLERLQTERVNISSQITEAETRASMIASVEPAQLMGASDADVLEKLERQLDRELAVNTEEHPSVISLKRRVEIARENLANTEANASPDNRLISQRDTELASTRATIIELKERLAATDSEITATDELVKLTPKTGEKLEAIEERAQVLQQKYLEFLRKVGEAEMAQTLEAAQFGARVSIVDRARKPSFAEQSRRKVALLGLVATFAMACGLGLLFELLDPVMVNRNQVESMSGLPVMGSVAHID